MRTPAFVGVETGEPVAWAENVKRCCPATTAFVVVAVVARGRHGGDPFGMFELLRKSAMIETGPRAGAFLWLYHQIPLVHAIGGLDFWVTTSAVTLVVLSLALDCWRIRQVLQDRKSARYWSDLQARHRNAEIDPEDDIF